MPGQNQSRNNKGKGLNKAPKKNIELQFESGCKIYAEVKSVLGNCQFIVKTMNGEEKRASVSGAVKNTRTYVTVGKIVLIEPLSDDENGQWQIVFMYNDGQKKILESTGKLMKKEDPVKKVEKQMQEKKIIEKNIGPPPQDDFIVFGDDDYIEPQDRNIDIMKDLTEKFLDGI